MEKLTVGLMRILPLCVVVLLLPVLAAAFPIAAPGTEGFELIVQSTEPVVATYQGNSATFSNDLYLMLDGSGNPGDDGNPANDRFLFNNHTSPVESTVDLGSFPVGTKLIFRLHVNNTGIDYFTGSASRNPDNQPHARAQANWLPNETLVSFEDWVDFLYNDLSFSFANTVGACNPTLREPCNSTAQPVYSNEIPRGLAPNLIVVVHGCCTNESDLKEWNKFGSSIHNAILQNQTPGAWEIVVWNWTYVTGSIIPGLPGLPNTAYDGAPQVGQYLGMEIVNPSANPGWQYNYVHFIAHSAGSRVIHEAAKYIKTKDSTSPFIHSTFLDAYCPPPLPLLDATFYPYYSDYAEQYVDRGFPLTDLYLWAYNFDVTYLDKPVLGTKFLSDYGWSNDIKLDYHFWPVDWYQQSIDRPSEFGFGFSKSFEYNRNGGDPKTFYDHLKQDLKSQWNISAGDACVLTTNTACGSPGLIAVVPPPIVDYTKLLISWINGGVGAIQKSITGVVETIEDNVGGWLATLFTGSPVWFEVPITTTQTFHLLKFDYEFLSAAGSQGILTVFVDDQLIYAIDERITAPGINTAQNIPGGELTPGTHTIGFRLDPYTSVQSVARISNIEFGAVVNKPVFVYPVDGQILNYADSYLFQVEPNANAQGFLWGFFQNGVMVWENLRDEGVLSGNEYGIHPGTTAHSKFVPGSVEVWVRALINGQWTDATIITIYLQ